MSGNQVHFSRRDEEDGDTNIVKGEGEPIVDNKSHLSKEGLDLSKNHSKADLDNTSEHNISVESFHVSNVSIDPSKMSISGNQSANDMSETYTKTPLELKVPSSRNLQEDPSSATEALTVQQNVASPEVGIENSSNVESSPACDHQNRTPQNKPEEIKNEDDDRNEVKLEDLKYVGDLGSGCQGHVKKMIHKPSGTPIALKVVDGENEDKFFKEIKTATSTLQDCLSEYIVKCYGAYLTGGTFCMVLEYMDKGTLADILKKVGMISEPIIGMITYQILKGLEYLHKNMKVIHRNIKPSNILINSEGQVKIADFYVSGKHDFNRQVWSGSFPYMSPERYTGEKYSFDSDIWSLGFTILDCALVQHPYLQVKSYTYFNTYDDLTTKPAPSLPDTYSNSLKDFVSICLRKEASTRTTATELLRHDFVRKYAVVKRDKFKGWLSTI